jgi:hypothetical protein
MVVGGGDARDEAQLLPGLERCNGICSPRAFFQSFRCRVSRSRESVRGRYTVWEHGSPDSSPVCTFPAPAFNSTSGQHLQAKAIQGRGRLAADQTPARLLVIWHPTLDSSTPLFFRSWRCRGAPIICCCASSHPNVTRRCTAEMRRQIDAPLPSLSSLSEAPSVDRGLSQCRSSGLMPGHGRVG